MNKFKELQLEQTRTVGDGMMGATLMNVTGATGGGWSCPRGHAPSPNLTNCAPNEFGGCVRLNTDPSALPGGGSNSSGNTVWDVITNVIRASVFLV